MAFGHAVVIGGSLSGLAAARVLTDHFEQVTLVERDRFPQEGPAFRKGVPQSRHVHILLPSGQAALEQLFPGLQDDLSAAGAVWVGIPEELLWLSAAGWGQRFAASHQLLSSSRELIDWTVRRRLVAIPNVRVLEQREVIGLVADANGDAVSGLSLRVRGDGRVERSETLRADLVVDASGRGSRAPDWLEALGYERPQQTIIDAKLRYATCQYVPPPGFSADWKGLLLAARPPEEGRFAVLLPIEGGRWIVGCQGVGDDHPPTDETGFLQWTRGLRSPILYETIRDAEPASPIYGFRNTTNQRRRYERLRRWPEGFVVVGDAACTFNPVYGQGMSVAAVTAVALDRALRVHRGREGLARRLQHQVAKSNRDAWLVSSGEDLRYPTTTGARVNLQTRLLHRYIDRVTRTAMIDQGVNRVFVDALTLLARPTSLLRPSVALRVLGRQQGAPPDGPPVVRSPAAVSSCPSPKSFVCWIRA
ncbi:MAG: FAD-dependent oxidoreductase, partial [Egibacteraceae bacterium]